MKKKWILNQMSIKMNVFVRNGIVVHVTYVEWEFYWRPSIVMQNLVGQSNKKKMVNDKRELAP